jgi:hypothetical protein
VQQYGWMHDGSPVNRVGNSASCQNTYGFSSTFPKNHEIFFAIAKENHEFFAQLPTMLHICSES